MERSEPSLKPEWLLRPTVPATTHKPVTSPRADDHGRGASSRNRSSGRDRDRSSQQSSSRRGSSSSGSRRNDRDGTGKSRGYGNFGKHSKDRIQEKDLDFRERESRLVQPDDPLRDGFESFSSCRSEKDRLNRTRSKVAIPNRAGVSLDNGNVSKKDNGVISFEREFPHLGSEDKNGKQDIGRVPSPGISTPIQNIPLVVSDGWNSVLAEVPALVDPNINSVSSSSSPAGSSKPIEVSNSGSALSMAETVMQSPLNICTTPQLSIDAQKIEERTMRQCILRPLTPSSNKISASISLDKLLKSKGARAGESNGPIKVAPQLSIQPSSNSVRTPVKTELVKQSQSGSLQVLSREQNGTVNTAAKDITSNNPVSPVLGRSSSMEPMRKSIVNPKLKFIENGNSSCEEANSCEGSQRHLSDNEEIIPPSESHDVLDEGSLGIQVDDKGSSSSPVLGTQDISSKKPQEDNVDIVVPVYVNDGSVMPNSVDNEARLLLEEANPAQVLQHIDAREENPCPAQEFESIGAGGEEELNLLRSMGWDENEEVQPLQQEEIADCVRQNVRLQQKLQECRG
uniref:Uncharacterized protein n=1 Tax=Zea mays TaxID=4577 RepID=A0A804MFG8_MAIZE